MFKPKKIELFSYDDLTNIQISNELIEKVIIHGEYKYLEILSTNLKFKNLEPDLILSMSKIEETVWYKKTQNQMLMTLIFLVSGLFILKFPDLLNGVVFVYFSYLFFIKKKKDIVKENNKEEERKKYILTILEKTDLKLLNLKIEFN